MLAISPDAEELFGFDVEGCWAGRVQGENHRAIYVELVGGFMAERRVPRVMKIRRTYSGRVVLPRFGTVEVDHRATHAKMKLRNIFN